MEALGREEEDFNNLAVAQNRLGAFDGVTRIAGGHLGKLERTNLVEVLAHRVPDHVVQGSTTMISKAERTLFPRRHRRRPDH
jgi:hypothetical protein